MAFAVLHSEKGSISSGGIGNHIDRKEGKEHSYRHADPEKRNLNVNFEVTPHCKKPLHEAINDRIKEGYTHKNKAGELKKIRKDAVKYCTHILTGSHEKMKEIEKSPGLFQKWVNKNFEFMAKEFGRENIVRFTLHRDEKTPHIHCVTVPLTSTGKLSAKDMIGNRKAMQSRQDRYALAMEEFGLKRGKRNTGIKHEDAREYYTRINEALSVEPEKPKIVNKTVLGVKIGIDVEKTIEKVERSNLSLKTQNKAQEQRISQLQKQQQQQEASLNSFFIRTQEEEEQKKKLVKSLNEAKEMLHSSIEESYKREEKTTNRLLFDKEAYQREKTAALNSIFFRITMKLKQKEHRGLIKKTTEDIKKCIRNEFKDMGIEEGNEWKVIEDFFEQQASKVATQFLNTVKEYNKEVVNKWENILPQITESIKNRIKKEIIQGKEPAVLKTVREEIKIHIPELKETELVAFLKEATGGKPEDYISALEDFKEEFKNHVEKINILEEEQKKNIRRPRI